ncbi:MAG TPA: bifunctional aspartate kinase/homoserine dehydrogenase I [Xanthomonadaceae bacterium]|nr:bifunctional aspartate kinase/homoserine dehydrogenase I [Xanthomonadaceae bacterium]
MDAATLSDAPADAHRSASLAPDAHKFGGAALADAAGFRRAAGLLKAGAPRPQLAVVSATFGTTDRLVAALASARAGRDHADLPFLLASHRALLAPLGLAGDLLDRDIAQLDDDLAHLRAGKPDSGQAARISGAGEVWSSRILAALLGKDWAWLDARELLVVTHGELGARLDDAATREALAAWRRAHPQPNLIATGFLARLGDGTTTTLGRNGSDYSAALFAALFKAAELTIWKEVDGLMSADPRLEPEAVVLRELSYAEAMELAYFGTKALHPQSLAPAMAAGIALNVRDVRQPDKPGTRVVANPAPSSNPVKGLSLVRGLAALELQGSGLMGVPGSAERFFAALHRAEVSVVMITQASSEHSICALVRREQAQTGLDAARAEFSEEIAGGHVQGIALEHDLAVLAAVGDGMIGTPGIVARLSGAIAKAGISLRAIAQGSSERNVSLAIREADAERALRVAHTAFWLSRQTVSIGLIGPGNVGGALLRQILEAQPRLKRERQLDLRIRVVANSRKMLRSETTLTSLDLERGEALDLDAFAKHVKSEHIPHALIVDCSGRADMAERYEGWLAQGIHVVTPSKHAGSGDAARLAALHTTGAKTGARFRYEATVGAGLPVVMTLRNLIDTGDVPRRIAGLFSGTLAWLFNHYDGSRPFSELLSEARAAGYTEPDPRDDLSGTDVARKAVILAREAGWALSLDQVDVENLVPAQLRDVPLPEFLQRLGEFDAPMAERLAAAKAEGKVLRYLAEVDASGRASVALRAVESTHPAASAQGTDNLFAFHTARYHTRPLVVKGPGAGPDVTAAGVFGDILAIAAHLGAKL